MIAALYVDARGVYSGLPGVDAWPLGRDARAYAGPHAVVAHPPCGPWSALRHLARSTTSDGADCAARALEQVRAYGGVLEHPARSKLWHRLPVVDGLPDEHGGYVVEIDQCAWGHVARKRTRLYIVGVPRAVVEATRRTGGRPTHWVSGSRSELRKAGHTGGLVPPGIKVCSAHQRRRTPELFARWLVFLAESAVRT